MYLTTILCQLCYVFAVICDTLKWNVEMNLNLFSQSQIAEYDVPSQDSTADSDDKPRPPLDLFQAIFLDSDSSSSSSDEYDRDENDDQKKPEGAPQSELQTVQGMTVFPMK